MIDQDKAASSIGEGRREKQRECERTWASQVVRVRARVRVRVSVSEG